MPAVPLLVPLIAVCHRSDVPYAVVVPQSKNASPAGPSTL